MKEYVLKEWKENSLNESQINNVIKKIWIINTGITLVKLYSNLIEKINH